MPDMEIAGKGVFVTGGTRGIGRAIVESLLCEKARVVFCGSGEQNGKAVEAEFQNKFGAGHVTFVKCDVSDAQEVEATWTSAVQNLGGVDICVNNSAVLNERTWEKMIAVNQIGTIRICLLALEHMRGDKEGRGGVIINVSSAAGYITVPYAPVYTATKHAVVAFTKALANSRSNSSHGVRWGLVCPFGVATDMILKQPEGAVMDPEGFASRFLRPPILTSEEVAVAFMKLLKDENSNGAIMEVSHARGGVYRQRQITDTDGKSNVWSADTSFEEDPPYI